MGPHQVEEGQEEVEARPEEGAVVVAAADHLQEVEAVDVVRPLQEGGAGVHLGLQE